MKSLTVSLKCKTDDKGKAIPAADKLIYSIYDYFILGGTGNYKTSEIKKLLKNCKNIEYGIESGMYRYMDFSFKPDELDKASLFMGYLSKCQNLDNIIKIIHLVQVRE